MDKYIFLVCLGLLAGFGGTQAQHPALRITPLTGNIYIYTTWVPIDGSLYPSNGLYLVTNRGAVVVDAPFDTTQFQPLVDSILQRHHQRVVMNIATHFHRDRTAALGFFRRLGAATYSTRLTDEYSQRSGMPRAEFLFEQDTVFRVGGGVIQTFFAGEGHTRDNIVLWFDRERVLYGGCLVKSAEAGDMGNLSDANMTAWPGTVRILQRKYPQAVYVIPGHQAWGDAGLLQHTLDLLNGSVK
jgi:metallo-beta-lactamase class B